MSTPTAPPPLTCSSRPVPANATELDKLQYCREAVDCSLAIANYNSAIATYNDHINSKNKAAQATWQAKFDLDKEQKKKELENERRDTKCVLWTDFIWFGRQNEYCRNDFVGFEADTSVSEAGVQGAINGGCIAGQGKARCRRTAYNINAELENFIKSYPSSPIPEPLLQQNTTKININCCLNFMNIVGTAEGNEQSCLATIDQLSEKLKEVGTIQVTEDIKMEEKNITIEKNGDIKTVTENKQADTQTKQADTQSKQTDKQENDKQEIISKPLNTVTSESGLPDWLIYVAIGVGIIFLLFIGLIIYNIFFKSTTPGYVQSPALQTPTS